MSRISSALYLLACFGVATSAAAAADQSGPSSYVIERSLDNGETWAPRGTVVVTGAAVNSAKTKFNAATVGDATEGLSEKERAQLLGAERLIFRVREDDNNKKVSSSTGDDDTEIARVVTTPCSLIRGFELKTTKEVELVESLNVIITKSADNSQNVVTGLQFVPRTNLHHSSSKQYGNKAEACDTQVLSLFPKMTVSTTVGVARTTVPKRTPKYEESLYAGGNVAGGDTAAAGQQEQQQQKDPNQKYNEEGKPVDAEGKVIPEPDNRSFFEKYWHYILMFVVWQLLQSFINPPKKEGAAAGAAAAKK